MPPPGAPGEAAGTWLPPCALLRWVPCPGAAPRPVGRAEVPLAAGKGRECCTRAPPVRGWGDQCRASRLGCWPTSEKGWTNRFLGWNNLSSSLKSLALFFPLLKSCSVQLSVYQRGVGSVGISSQLSTKKKCLHLVL